MFKDDAIASLFLKTSSNLFNAWCNKTNPLDHHYFQTKLLHHYFQKHLNFSKRWCNQVKLLHHFFGLGWACLAWAYQSNKFEQQRVVATSLNLFKRQVKVLNHFLKHVQTRLMNDAMKKNYFITVLETFELFKKMMQSSKIKAGLGWPGLDWAGLA